MSSPDDAQRPEGLNSAEVIGILDDTTREADLEARLEQISQRFLGRPYLECPLGGGPDLAEELRITLEGFDCVTYVEHVVALACSKTLNEFVSKVRRIRYEAGEIDWSRRNHYMTDWARNNEAEGFFANLTKGPDTVEKLCTLDLISGLPAKVASFSYLPTRNFSRVGELARTGDLVFFVSTKGTLDVFHTGLLIVREGQMIVRHAARSAGAVVDQDLREFVARNEPAGFFLLRPLCQR
jgi:D-alanyl-D-alanine carboxypeptidase/D-alanyl-D-alanine-endopeptidase (penicillin-binding protein 4)